MIGETHAHIAGPWLRQLVRLWLSVLQRQRASQPRHRGQPRWRGRGGTTHHLGRGAQRLHAAVALRRRVQACGGGAMGGEARRHQRVGGRQGWRRWLAGRSAAPAPQCTQLRAAPKQMAGSSSIAIACVHLAAAFWLLPPRKTLAHRRRTGQGATMGLRRCRPSKEMLLQAPLSLCARGPLPRTLPPRRPAAAPQVRAVRAAAVCLCVLLPQHPPRPCHVLRPLRPAARPCSAHTRPGTCWLLQHASMLCAPNSTRATPRPLPAPPNAPCRGCRWHGTRSPSG